MKTHKFILLAVSSLLALQMMGSEKPMVEVSKNACISGNGTQIKGQVVDKVTHEPLVGAKVKLVNCNLEVYTDFDGNFSFEQIGAGVHILQVEYVSYETRFTTVNVNNQDSKYDSVIMLKNARN